MNRQSKSEERKKVALRKTHGYRKQNRKSQPFPVVPFTSRSEWSVVRVAPSRDTK